MRKVCAAIALGLWCFCLAGCETMDLQEMDLVSTQDVAVQKRQAEATQPVALFEEN